MDKVKKLHLFVWNEKFLLPFVKFINEEFNPKEHEFIVYGFLGKLNYSIANNVVLINSILSNIIFLSKAMNSADKIFIHGLFNNHLLYILIAQPWLLKKCHWIIWGGDLYHSNKTLKNKNWRFYKNEILRYLTIKNFGYIITQIKGDYDIAVERYSSRAKWLDSFMYPSNLYQAIDITEDKNDECLNILIGNSADPSNNHIEILKGLEKYKRFDIKIYAPLSYGDIEYSNYISNIGKDIFGDKFIPIYEFMSFDTYLNFLTKIDIAFFNHKRQQAMGNTITLLGMGKKVYIRKDVVQWSFLESNNIKVFDIRNIDISKIDFNVAKNNQLIISKIFSKENLLMKLNAIF